MAIEPTPWIEELHKFYRGVYGMLIIVSGGVSRAVEGGLDLGPVFSWIVPMVLAGLIALFGELAGASVQKTIVERARRARINRQAAQIASGQPADSEGPTTP